MIQVTDEKLTLQEFLTLPDGEVACELINGQSVAKMSPKFLHSHTQKKLLLLLDRWAENRGRVEPEWAVIIHRRGKDWVPVPDILYISYTRLSREWLEDEACPVAPELVIEIISPGQSFGDLAEKATDYLAEGIERVWIIDTQAKTITVFCPSTVPHTYRGETPITDKLLPGLELSCRDIF